jgi:hypothetical protein
MTKVSDMIGDYAPAQGEAGRVVDMDRILELAREMRTLLDAIYRWNLVCDQDELIATFEYLNAMERDAWRKVVQARGRHGIT